MERRGRGGRPARHAGRRDLEDLLRGPAAGSMVLHQGTTQGKPAEGWPEVKEFFEFDRRGTGYRQEILAGLTTFLTMAYIIIVNPAILEAAGIPRGPSTVAPILAAAVGTVGVGVDAGRPLAGA